MGHAADRDLLFGLVALQNGMVTREALVAAFAQWVLDKRRRIADLLVEQGALAPEVRAALDQMVALHAKLHGDDAAKSLAAISSVDSAREQLSRLADPDLQASIAHLPSHPVKNDEVFRTVLPEVGQSTLAGARFQRLRLHARGGLGEVFIARDTELNRDVALKEIQSKFADDPHGRHRFLFEGEVTGGLEHPSIVPVYGLGTYADGRPFYAMRFIKGDNLQAAIRRFHAERQSRRDTAADSLALRKLLGRFIDVCNAVAYAHDRGVLHRDLKPGNIMLGQYGETLVVDWGLAKLRAKAPPATTTELTAEAAATRALGALGEAPLTPSSGEQAEPTQMGSVLGSPAYMSPELAEGRHDLVDVTTDVFLLGATLFELLTGQAPYAGDASERNNMEEIVARAQRCDHPRPRELWLRARGALEAICLKAMARRPSDRYATVGALEADVERWLADEPVSAVRERLADRAARWTRKHRAVATSAAAALVLVAGVATLAAVVINGQKRQIGLQATEIATQRNEAVALAERERLASEEARRQSALATEQEAVARAQRDEAVRQRAAAEREARRATALRLASESRATNDSFPLLRLRLALQAVSLQQDAGESVSLGAIDALGSALANTGGVGLGKGQFVGYTADNAIVMESADGQVVLRDLDNLGLSHFLFKAGEARDRLSLSVDGRMLVISEPTPDLLGSVVTLRDCVNLETAPRVVHVRDARVHDVLISPDDRWLVTADATRLATATDSPKLSVRLWDLTNLDKAPRTLLSDGPHWSELSISLNSRWLVQVGGGHNVEVPSALRVWELTKQEEPPRILSEQESITDVVISPDSRWLTAASPDGPVRVWDLHKLDDGPKLLEGTEGSPRLSVSGDSRWLATARTSAGVMVWNMSAVDARPRAIDAKDCFCLSLSPDGHWLATGGLGNGVVELWDLTDDFGEPTLLHGHDVPRNGEDSGRVSGGITQVSVSPDGRHMVTMDHDGSARVWKLGHPASEPRVLRHGHFPGIKSLCTDAQGHWLVSGGGDGIACVYNLNDLDAKPRILEGHRGWVTCALITADGKSLVTTSGDGAARIWNLDDLDAMPRVLNGHSDWITCALITPDERSLLTGSPDTTVRLWDLTRPNHEPRVLHGRDEVNCMSVSPDGRWLAVSGRVPTGVSVEPPPFSDVPIDPTVDERDQNTPVVWDLHNLDAEPHVLSGHGGFDWSVSTFSLDSKWLVMCTDTTARVWDVAHLDDEPRLLQGHEDSITCAVMAGDGRLVTGAMDGTARVWDLSEPRPVSRVLSGHSAGVASIAVSNDGRWLATGSIDGSAKIWDLADLDAAPRSLEGHSQFDGCQVLFSPDSRWLITGDAAGATRIYRLRPEDLIAAALEVLGK